MQMVQIGCQATGTDLNICGIISRNHTMCHSRRDSMQYFDYSQNTSTFFLVLLLVLCFLSLWPHKMMGLTKFKGPRNKIKSIYMYIYIYISGGPLSALTCCVNVRLLSGDKKNIAVNLFSKLGWELGLYYASYDDFHPDILARMYT